MAACDCDWLRWNIVGNVNSAAYVFVFNIWCSLHRDMHIKYIRIHIHIKFYRLHYICLWFYPGVASSNVLELLGKFSNWWTHYLKDGPLNGWGCQATRLVQVVLNQTLKFGRFDRNTGRVFLVAQSVRLRSQNDWNGTFKLTSPGLQEQRWSGPKREKYPKSDAAADCNHIMHTFHWARWCAIPRNRFAIVYVKHNPEVSATTKEKVRPMPLCFWFLNMKFSLILFMIVLTLSAVNHLWLHTWSILRLPTN